MSKNPFNIKSSGGSLKKLIILGLALGLLTFVIKAPVEAAGAVDSAASRGSGVLDSVIQFFRALG
ncbi:hypothetical protein H4696_009757 [Amycolatopsis lexingtonensis]|uniref:Uncharacterized protein n=1 Tax=Amycolatopsis lexingtonensis TaxID=218822 RepID=A0ABR9II73_9PSEU|nr:hypothetical protein [Amycolatopsis lexingtonensis]MBE1502657.1 hypothetical protein [Amycolatopsis lexingtonensis]